jgi:hypothetical protein
MTSLVPALPRHHNLPTHPTALVGRDREVANLCQLVLSDEGGGIGRLPIVGHRGRLPMTGSSVCS